VVSLISGVGIDLVSIERIERVYKKHPKRFLKRIFTFRENEIFTERASSMRVLAARYAAKEAVLKAIGCGIGPAALNEVEIITLPGQQPVVKLYGEASRLAAERKISAVTLSMTHEPPFACACAAALNLSGDYN
jgi:holo-[acyl-carrier protein] synthase